MSDDILIMGICGTYDLDSANGRMLELLLEECRNLGARTETWDHGSKPLPLVGAEGSWDHPDVKEFQEMATAADAFVLSSPEYHGTMSGVMKNCLDWLYSKHTSGKVFGLMSTLGGQSSNNTLNHMRIAARWIQGWVAPEQIAVPHIKKAFDENGNLIDDSIVERISSLADSLVTNTRKLMG
ncbi:MAG: NADPH-dependent FMN reductase [Euryarchaeota archaeon]|nr:NADPH-dependent FMN reductase [Euryarchaeota archaeon]